MLNQVTLDNLTDFYTDVVSLHDFSVPTPASVDRKADRMPWTVFVRGQKYDASKRFWQSIFAKYGVGDTTLRYFTPMELINRIIERRKTDTLRITSVSGQLQGVSATTRQATSPTSIIELGERSGFLPMQYFNGEIILAKKVDQEFKIGNDEFQLKHYAKVPIDGYGNPIVTIAPSRLVCANQIVTWGTDFGQKVQIGRGMYHALSQALPAFENEEALVIMRKRLQASLDTVASLGEVREVERLLHRAYAKTLPAFHEVVGDLPRKYGVTNLDAIGPVQQRVLPTEARVYDLLNMLTEAATHGSDPSMSISLNNRTGRLLARPQFDLEGMGDDVPVQPKATFFTPEMLGHEVSA